MNALLNPETGLAELEKTKAKWTQELDRVSRLLRFEKRRTQLQLLQQDQEILLSNVLALTKQISQHPSRIAT